MKFAVLGSGSKGNALVVSVPDFGYVLVDAGLSAKQIRERLGTLGIFPEDLRAILVTHEHCDHVKGLRVLVSKLQTPVYASSRTAYCIKENAQGLNWKCFSPGDLFSIDEIQIGTFSVSHDAVEPVGYKLTWKEKSIAIVSDTGKPTTTVLHGVRGVAVMYVESNYDPALLASDMKRPFSTKQRIASMHGHLSNQQCAEFLANIESPCMHSVVLGHLSSDCNRPELAIQTVKNYLNSCGKMGINVHCSTQDQVLGWINV